MSRTNINEEITNLMSKDTISKANNDMEVLALQMIEIKQLLIETNKKVDHHFNIIEKNTTSKSKKSKTNSNPLRNYFINNYVDKPEQFDTVWTDPAEIEGVISEYEANWVGHDGDDLKNRQAECIWDNYIIKRDNLVKKISDMAGDITTEEEPAKPKRAPKVKVEKKEEKAKPATKKGSKKDEEKPATKKGSKKDEEKPAVKKSTVKKGTKAKKDEEEEEVQPKKKTTSKKAKVEEPEESEEDAVEEDDAEEEDAEEEDAEEDAEEDDAEEEEEVEEKPASKKSSKKESTKKTTKKSK
jgi:hypothetical protein